MVEVMEGYRDDRVPMAMTEGVAGNSDGGRGDSGGIVGHLVGNDSGENDDVMIQLERHSLETGISAQNLCLPPSL